MVWLGQHQGLSLSPSFDFNSLGSVPPPSEPHSVPLAEEGTWDGVHNVIRTSFLPNAPIKQALSCDSAGSDVKFEGPQGRVVCPPNCQKGAVVAYGATIHPMRSAVCLSAIVDGIIPYQGGEFMITKVKGSPAYGGKDVGYAASLPMTNNPGEAFTMYPVDNIDLGVALPAEKKLSCVDTFEKLEMKKPGEMKAVQCPGDCGENGRLAGTTVYTPMSTVCRAAEHAGAIGSEAGHVIVVRGHGQPYFFGSKSGISGASTDAPGGNVSYTVSLPVPDVMSRVLEKDPIDYSGPKEDAMPSPALTALMSAPPHVARPQGRHRKFASFL